MSKKLFIILGFIAAILAVVAAATPLFEMAVVPIIIAFICGLIVIFLSKKDHSKTKTIQYIFLLVIIALALTIYKAVTIIPEIDNTEQSEQLDEESIKDSEEILQEIKIDDDI